MRHNFRGRGQDYQPAGEITENLNFHKQKVHQDTQTLGKSPEQNLQLTKQNKNLQIIRLL